MASHKYVDENDSAAMLAAKRSAGVTSDVNLRIPLCTGNEVGKQGQTQGRHHQKSKIGYQWLHKKYWCSPKIFLKKTKKTVASSEPANQINWHSYHAALVNRFNETMAQNSLTLFPTCHWKKYVRWMLTLLAVTQEAIWSVGWNHNSTTVEAEIFLHNRFIDCEGAILRIMIKFYFHLHKTRTNLFTKVESFYLWTCHHWC